MERQSLAIPAAIVIAAGLIAGAIYLNDGNATDSAITGTANPDEQREIDFAPVTEDDHIRGNPNAPIVLVEYSDYDCPFCSQFHETMNRVMERYGTTGEVAWVYRHFPIEQLHPNADTIAEASECAAELGGNDAFWTFTDLVFAEKPVETRNGQQYIGLTDMSKLPEFAERAGVDRSQFELCANSGKYEDQIKADIAAAQAAGGTGTPYTIILAGNEIIGTLPGAIPFEDYTGQGGTRQPGVSSILNDLLEQSSQSAAAPSGE